MNRLEKEMRKDKKYNDYCCNQENSYKACSELSKELKIDIILNWLNNLLIKLGF